MPAKDRKKLAAELRKVAERLETFDNRPGSQSGATTVIDKNGQEMEDMQDGLELLTLRSAGGSSSRTAQQASPSSSSSDEEACLTYR